MKDKHFYIIVCLAMLIPVFFCVMIYFPRTTYYGTLWGDVHWGYGHVISVFAIWSIYPFLMWLTHYDKKCLAQQPKRRRY